jgi:hypothetical protein
VSQSISPEFKPHYCKKKKSPKQKTFDIYASPKLFIIHHISKCETQNCKIPRGYKGEF